MSRVLIVDDEPTICWALENALAEDGHDVSAVASAEAAFDAARSQEPDVILMDVRLPGIDGIRALQRLRDQFAATPVIIMTAFGNLETAVGAVHSGAFEYVAKPFDLDEIVDVIRRALDARRPAAADPAATTAAASDAETDDTASDGLLLGKAPVMQALFRRIALVARHDVPVLISGESGTGKELVARVIHQYSRRPDGPFVPVCVPVMSDSVVESELFGHVAGAFTGAAGTRQGLLMSADGGTVFLDEIGDVALPLQVKLLRVLETQQVTPVGSDVYRRSRFRLIAATNRPLDQMVADGRFREDLFYRLNVFRIELPPLRDRRDDIPLLARHFLNRDPSHPRRILSDAAVEELLRRDWQGNVRELQHAMEHAVVVSRSDVITPDAFPPPLQSRSESPDADSLPSIRAVVRQWIAEQAREPSGESADDERPSLLERFLNEVEPVLFGEALRIADGNRSEAARWLGIHRQTLREKLKRYEADGTD